MLRPGQTGACCSSHRITKHRHWRMKICLLGSRAGGVGWNTCRSRRIPDRTVGITNSIVERLHFTITGRCPVKTLYVSNGSAWLMYWQTRCIGRDGVEVKVDNDYLAKAGMAERLPVWRNYAWRCTGVVFSFYLCGLQGGMDYSPLGRLGHTC